MSENTVIDQTEVPSTLVEYDQWICWRAVERDGKPTKVPITPESGAFASATDAGTWTDFETATAYAATDDVDGLGFVFTDADPLVGVDLDDCRDPETGERDEIAADIIERLDSYTEVSPSGTGYHVLVEGALPEGRNRKGDVECYDSARFFTVTGDHVAGIPTAVARRQDALVAIHREYVQEDDTASEVASASSGADDGPAVSSSTPEIDLDDEALLEKARAASNGEKFERLWNGNILGYDSQSEADMALCCLLAFWTGGDEAQMDRLFRQSGLLREKWDEVHYADGSTYGEKTIERAVTTTSEVYEPESSPPSDQPAGSTADSRRTPSGDTGQHRVYLKEKNQVLSERVSELEATLAEKTDRIAELEVDVRELEETVTKRENRIDALTTQQETTSADDDETRTTQSLWILTKRLYRGENE